jgi:diguanylate cyclase (GGDEF)-like protein/PAS domain S-box-containing protein
MEVPVGVLPGGSRRSLSHQRPHEASERLAAIIDGSDDAIIAIDVAGRFAEWNAGAERLFGYTADEAANLSPAVLLPPERRGDRPLIERVLEGERFDHHEIERVHRDGSRLQLSLSLSALRDPDGTITGAFAIARDITERRAAEAERSQLAALVGASADAIIATDVDFRITNCNAAAAGLYHMAAEEMVGRLVTEILASVETDDERIALLERALAGETMRSEGVRVRRDGSEFAVAGTVAPVRASSGEIVGVVWIARDVTTEWRARKALERDERRSRLLADASRMLDRSLQTEHVVGAITRLVASELADLCCVVLADEVSGETQLVEVVAADPIVARIVRTAFEQGPLTDDPGTVTGPAMRTGADVLIDPVPPELVAGWLSRYPELADAPVALTVASIMVVPLRAGGSNVGLIFIASLESQRHFDRDDLLLARELANRTAQSLENARLLTTTTYALAEAEAAARELRAAQQRFSSAFANAPIGMALVSATDDSMSRIEDANPALCELTGFVQDDLRGRDLIETLVHPADRLAVRAELERLIRGETGVLSAEHRYVRNGGTDVWVQTSVARLPGQAEANELVLQVQDITERKRYEGQLRYLADHDPLTGLYNRRRFVEELDRAAVEASLRGIATAVLVLDIDHFKYINDTYGHTIGDEVLTGIARTLVGRTRDTDVLGRLGGDVFGIVLTHSNARDVQTVALALLAELRERDALMSNGQTISVTASVGYRVVERGDGLGADELIVEADIAMCDAKEKGRNRVAVAGRDSIEPTRLRRRLAMSEQIRRALERDDGFMLYEQPICALGNGAIDRTEILVRMPDGEGDLLPPSVFLYIADHFGLMPELDMWVIAHAIELLAARQANGITLGMEVNLSGTSIGDSAVIDFIAESVRNAGIDPTALTFEVTETEAIVNVDRARVLSRRLSSLGCQFALDDFGAGFGSFYYLKHLPFDVVKIDGDFIKSLPASQTDQLTVQAIVTIARGLQKQTVAEFVGDDRTIEMLREFGVDFAQGYHIGEPAPAILVPHHLSRSSS